MPAKMRETEPALTSMAQRIASLNPSYFALVMATGIVSLACRLLEMPSIAVALFWLNLVQFVLLAVLTSVRLVRYRSRFLADLFDHKRGVGFFTSVAATCVLGTQCLLVGHWLAVAIAL